MQHRPFRAHALRFEPGPPGSGFIFRHRVRAYKPTVDWITAAEPDVRKVADIEFQRMTDDITDMIERARAATGRSFAPRRAVVRTRTKSGRFR
jgi:hypothetical protein